MTFDPTPIQLNQFVYHDRPYRHPQLGSEVGRDFFDRLWERDQAWQALTHSAALRSVIIVAERRMGKTSLLRYLVEQLKTTPGYAAVQLPIGGSLHSADDLFGEIVDKMAAELGCGDEALPDQVAGLTIVEQLQALDQLCAAAPNVMVVLCLDELDACLEHQETPPAERAKIASLIAALVTRRDRPIRLLCTMIRPPERLPMLVDAAWLHRTAIIRLAPFTRPDLDEMLTELAQAHLGQRLSDGDLTLLYRQSGGWPFFAKLLLVCLGETEPGPDRLARAVEAATRHPVVGEAMEHILRNYFDRDEKAFILELAGQPKSDDRGAGHIERRDPHTAPARQLAARHFLQVDANGQYSFRIGLLGAWFRQWSKFAEMAQMYRAM